MATSTNPCYHSKEGIGFEHKIGYKLAYIKDIAENRASNKTLYNKQALIENPTLQPLQPDREVILYIDASRIALASAIIQFDDNKIPHFCAFLSQATTESQQRTSHGAPMNSKCQL